MHQDPETLKIISLPEFFFRGPVGAYSLQNVLGDALDPNSFISQVQSLLKGARWKVRARIYHLIPTLLYLPFNLHVPTSTHFCPALSMNKQACCMS